MHSFEALNINSVEFSKRSKSNLFSVPQDKAAREILADLTHSAKRLWAAVPFALALQDTAETRSAIVVEANALTTSSVVWIKPARTATVWILASVNAELTLTAKWETTSQCARAQLATREIRSAIAVWWIQVRSSDEKVSSHQSVL